MLIDVLHWPVCNTKGPGGNVPNKSSLVCGISVATIDPIRTLDNELSESTSTWIEIPFILSATINALKAVSVPELWFSGILVAWLLDGMWRPDLVACGRREDVS